MNSLRLTSEVQSTGETVCRDTICRNDKVILHTIKELGSRPAVPTLEVHIKAFYDQLNVTVDRLSHEKLSLLFSLPRRHSAHTGVEASKMYL